MSTSTPAQRRIAAWFDSTYRRKGTRYLRPVQAYWIFPQLLEATPRDELLDVACGPGVLLRAASDYTPHLYGCDISPVAVAQARAALPQARVLVANAEALPYRDATFDIVTCLGSLERMIDRRGALREMLRVGRSGARYCLLVRNSNTARWRYLDASRARWPALGHMDADTVDNWTALFEQTGFRVRRILPDQYPLQRAQLWRSFLLRRVDFRNVVGSHLPLERANEFIFVLDKRS